MKKPIHHKVPSALMLACALVMGIGFGTAKRAAGAAIEPGFDLFMTPAGGAILPGTPWGDIPLVGVPIDPAHIGTTDTVVRRDAGLADGATGRIEAEIVALSLKSIDPVFIPSPPTDGLSSDSEAVDGSFFDVFVTLDGRMEGDEKLNPSSGYLDITTHDATGGTFDSLFDVFTKITLTPVGGSDSFVAGFRHDTLTSSGSEWSHTGPPFLTSIEGVDFILPSGDPPFTAGHFYPLVVHHVGPHPNIVPPGPVAEPGTLLLLGSGLVGLAGAGWRRRRK